MRLVKCAIDRDDVEQTRRTLADHDVECVVTPTDDDGRRLVEFPVPPQGVGPIFEALDEAGVERSYTVAVSAETVETDTADELNERFLHGTQESDAVARQEIRSRASEMAPGPVTYYAMTLLSAVVAAAGLLLDAPTIVVGSMVIAPQVGAALTGVVGVTLDDRRLIWTGFRSQVAGLVAAVVGVFCIATVLQQTAMVPPSLDPSTVEQLGKRTSPGLLSGVVGLAAGAAGAFGLATALPISLVGVMIAAAIVPAAAAVGIGLAWSLPSITSGALVLLTANVVGINLAAFAVLWAFGYRPETWEPGRYRRNARAYWPTLVTVCALVVALVGVGGLVSAHSAFSDTVEDEVGVVVDGPAYDSVSVVELRVGFTAGGLGGPREVSLVVVSPADREPPPIAEPVARRVAAATGQEVSVEVEFRDRERATATAARSPDVARRSVGRPVPG
jgi:uncharacterized hydrophobic protein (TIGR00341 family)